MNAKNSIYDEDQIEEIEELEKLSDHQLKARLVYELNRLNLNYTNANALNLEKFYEYLDWCDKLKDEKEWLSFKDYQNLEFTSRQQSAEEYRRNTIETLKKRQEFEEKMQEFNDKNKENIINQIKEYCENNDDWMLKHVTERIQFFRQKKFNYKFYNWNQYGVDDIKDAHYRLVPLANNEIRFIIEPIYNKDKNQN